MILPEGRALPIDVYRSFVGSLYEFRQVLLIGMLAHVATYVLVFSKTRDDVYLWAASGIIVVWGVRALGMRYFDRRSLIDQNYRELRLWEHVYNLGGMCATMILGVMSGYAILSSDDSFAQLACISVTLASMVSVVGRNYASRQAVLIMSLSACAPLVLSLLARMDKFSTVLAFLIVPFVLTIWSMSRRAREFLYTNVLTAREISTIAARFDLALNNMPHGLFLLDQNNRILVTNRRACEMLNLGDGAQLKDRYLDAVLRYGVGTTRIDKALYTPMLNQLEDLLSGAVSRALVQMSDLVFFEFTTSAREKGSVVLIFEDVSARVQAEAKMLDLVRFDTLTCLPNRDYFNELVSKALAAHMPAGDIGFMILDVADFKYVNDTRGHVVGDKLLCAIAENVKALAGEAAIAGRLMGDEFILFFPSRGHRRDLEAQMRQLHSRVQGRYSADGSTFSVIMSAGYVIAASSDFRLDDMQIKVDLALAESKRKNKGGCTAFEPEMDGLYLDRQKMKAELREAVARGEIAVAYQPMFVPSGARIDCCEALARWNHAERGPVAPDIFIPLAEEIGVILDITKAVLRQACLDCATWPDHVGVSVNLSALDLRSPDILSIIADIVAETQLAPARLHLEVTESCLIDEAAKVQAILQELRARGMTIAIDDFGTGYSSLSYLDTLPLDVIKIDRSFVRNIREDARRFTLLRGAVNLSRALGLQIVIEGVETRDQLALINEYKCADLIQGYVFAAPMTAAAVEALCYTLKQAPAAGPKGAAQIGTFVR